MKNLPRSTRAGHQKSNPSRDVLIYFRLKRLGYEFFLSDLRLKGFPSASVSVATRHAKMTSNRRSYVTGSVFSWLCAHAAILVLVNSVFITLSAQLAQCSDQSSASSLLD